MFPGLEQLVIDATSIDVERLREEKSSRDYSVLVEFLDKLEYVHEAIEKYKGEPNANPEVVAGVFRHNTLIFRPYRRLAETGTYIETQATATEVTERIRDAENPTLLSVLQTEVEHASQVEDSDYQPMFSADELAEVSNHMAEYLLPQKVTISASIGYNPDASHKYRLHALRTLRSIQGRNVPQMLKDRTFKRIDPTIIATLISIAEHDPHQKTAHLAEEMVTSYTDNGVL